MKLHEIGTGSVNVLAKQMALNMNMTMEIPDQGTQNVSGEIYLTDGWMYMKAIAPNVGAQWTRMPLTDELWAMQSQMINMTDFLKDPLDLDLAGSETIEGVDCYMLDVNPNVNTLTGWMEGQFPSGQNGIDLSGIDMSSILQNFSVKAWIAKDSYLLVKQQIVVKLDMASLESGSSSNATPMNMEMSSTLIYYDYGKSVTFQLPPEAINATELTLPQ